MADRVRVRRRPTSFSNDPFHQSHNNYSTTRPLRPGYQDLDCRLDENENLSIGGNMDGIGTANGTDPKNSKGGWSSPRNYFSESPVLYLRPLATILSFTYETKACPYSPHEKENSKGPSVEYHATVTNQKSKSNNIPTRQKGNPPLYTMDIASKSRHPQSHSLEISSEEEHRSSSDQKEFLMTVRQFAARLCMVAVVGSFLVCMLSNQSKEMNNVDFTKSNTRGIPRDEPPPLTRKDEEIANHRRKDMIKEDEVTLQEMGGLRKLRAEFEDWVKHHKREYINVEEKENRFQVWKNNHKR